LSEFQEAPAAVQETFTVNVGSGFENWKIQEIAPEAAVILVEEETETVPGFCAFPIANEIRSAESSRIFVF
jgi:hypothetical protein